MTPMPVAAASSARVIAALEAMGSSPHSIEALAGDVSSRRYYRAQRPEGAIIACLYPEPFDETEPARRRWDRLCRVDPATRINFASDPVAYVETTAWLTRNRIPVPKILGIAGRHGCILLEDVGDRSLEAAVQTMEPAAKLRVYRRAAEYLIRLQESTPAGCRRGLVGCSLRLDGEKLERELRLLLRALASLRGGDSGAAVDVALQDELAAIARRASPDRMVLCHRDYHSRNLYVHADSLVVLDHQDLRLGSPCYDVASLMWDPYVDLQPELRGRVLADLGVAAGDCRLIAVTCQRLLKALGTYLNVLLTGENPVFSRAASRALLMLRELLPELRMPLSATWETLDELHGELHARFDPVEGGR
ncbi:MAG: phosphotransferase [Candidatus Eisenbacteria bacterium]|nr:phosphotransferase [Candidatus Eisenbacteria bacterium]